MTNKDFWTSISNIIAGNFSTEGLLKLDQYAEQFISDRIIYKRFSPTEQHGCSAGGPTHVIASLLAAAEIRPDSIFAPFGSFKREQQLAETQEQIIEQWARASHCWIENADKILTQQFGEHIAEGGEAKIYDHGAYIIKTIGLDYYLQPIFALDRISLHNAWFPETHLKVLGFGREAEGNFVVIVEQAHIQGVQLTNNEIASFAKSLGFSLINPRNWTYATPQTYLSDLHDENLIKSAEGNIFVIDCDIRINIPELKCGGLRTLTTEVDIL